jgi:hypothetical protein
MQPIGSGYVSQRNKKRLFLHLKSIRCDLQKKIVKGPVPKTPKPIAI